MDARLANKWTKTAFALLVAGSAALHANDAWAQAWVGLPNSMSFTLGYSFGPSDAIIETQGQRIGPEKVSHHGLNFGLDYNTPLEGLALDASLPLLAVTYSGPGGGQESSFFVRHGRLDDGNTHLSAGDLRFGARYMLPLPPIIYGEEDDLATELFAASLHVAGSIPSHSYETLGFATIGRGLKQLHLGASIGRTLDPLLPNLYVHARYEFSLVERYETAFPETAEFNQNRSDLSLQIGYFVIPGLQVNAAADLRIMHGGFDFLDWLDVSQAVRDFHDPLLRENVTLIGGGVSYAVLEELTLEAYARIFVGGTNTRNASLFGGGVSWTIF